MADQAHKKGIEWPDQTAGPRLRRADLEDPRVVLSLLEADQVVAAKTQTHFGRRKLSPGVNLMLWALRGYVVLMMVIVVISVIQALGGAH